MTTPTERYYGLSPRDRVQLTTPTGKGITQEWYRLATVPNTKGWFAIAYDLSLHHVTEVAQTLCWESSTGCMDALHCGRCGNCGQRGGPYGCHCECDDYPGNACNYCDPQHEDNDWQEEY